METYQIFVEEHKGKISCLSGPEQGTEFQVDIPIKVIEEKTF
jgi:signal transduction histidine kinase